MRKTIHHVVSREGSKPGNQDINIPVADDLTSVPGIPLRESDVSFYSKVEPLESQNKEKSADRDWVYSVYSPEMTKYIKGHHKRTKPLVEAAIVSGEIEPPTTPETTSDVTENIRIKAKGLGFGEVGFTRFDRRYTFFSSKRWVKYPHAICLALEQDYVQTQSIPSMEAEHAHYGTYEIEGALGLELAKYIRSLGYHAQIQSPSNNTGAYIPMFVSAGLGQLGANGQLLSPHFGSRARLMIISTDAMVTYDQPIDYGIHKFCQTCQVCVNRCPGRALVKENVWWKGVKKNKLIYDRCRPVMARYEGCAICVKVCPVQRYGMKSVMEHYVETGEVLGKGTDNLEGYTIKDKGYFGPGDLPKFDREFFDIPHGTREEWLFEQFKKKLASEDPPSKEDLSKFSKDVKTSLDRGHSTVDGS